MNTTLLMNEDRATGLFNLLEFLLKQYKPENIAEKLIEDLMKDIVERLGKKVRGSYTKDYNLRLNPKEAKAYYIFFNQNKIDIGAGYIYEQNLVSSHIMLIDKIYA